MIENENLNELKNPKLNTPAIIKSDFMKYLNMKREEEIRFANECINNKTRYSDATIAFSLAIREFIVKSNNFNFIKNKKNKIA